MALRGRIARQYHRNLLHPRTIAHCVLPINTSILHSVLHHQSLHCTHVKAIPAKLMNPVRIRNAIELGHRTCATSKKSVLSKENIKQQSHTQLNRLKELWKKYGLVAIATYFTMYGTVLGSMYVAIESGWVAKKKISPTQLNVESESDFDVVTTTNRYAWLLCVDLTCRLSYYGI